MAKPVTLHVFCVLSVISAGCLAIADGRVQEPVVEERRTHKPSSYPEHHHTPATPVGLCDCYQAEITLGTPEVGLTCTKDGFFIAGFMAAGYPDGNREESLPLSPAICCRPCLPEHLADGEKAVGVMNMNCAEATGNSGSSCAADDKSFLTGFNNAAVVYENKHTAEAYYPYGKAQCCTPTLLLESGDIRELQRCNCKDPPKSVNQLTCARGDNITLAKQEGRLLVGFKHSITGKWPVPTSPSECCDVCLGPPQQPNEPAQDCSHVNHCNGHGYCYWGECQCLDGWSGEACQIDPPGSSHNGLSDPNSWALSLIVISGCMLGCCSKLLVCSCDRAHRRAQQNQNAQDMEEPMLGMQRNDDTSAEEWSTDGVDDSDEEDDDDDDDQEQAPTDQPPPQREVALSNAQLEEREQGSDNEDEDEEEGMMSCPLLPQGQEAELQDCSDDPQPTQAGAAAAAECGSATINMECVVCMTDRIQVVCVPVDMHVCAESAAVASGDALFVASQ
eukprot:CAMPEP_0197847322 /NCGR_PEP_ID=MMETSP1438-20131217/5710_1 /TAXON_ID=1461541 /ORGANISM="Pterosperma sp., Strain CCMP1384" /LENGTH=503 /DNA_ID=CAMNT_0043459205 /DNA_START=436 /DNA_END=1948 /DNA_ORIENTATION=+